MMNRQRRINAGVNKRYDEQTYCLVSFPDHSKHALVPSRVINIDPIDDRAATIKVRGIRRGVQIVGSGTYISLLMKPSVFSTLFDGSLTFKIYRLGSKEEMTHKASNFSSQACSEEVDIADQCEDRTFTDVNGGRQEDTRTPALSLLGQDNNSQFNRTESVIESTPATFDDDEDDMSALQHHPRVFTPKGNRSEFLIFIRSQ
jgi:hypothetical protein